MRAAMPPSACSATVRPKRDRYAPGSGSSLMIVPTPTASAMVAPRARESTNSKVSPESSWESSKARIQRCCSVSPGSKYTHQPLRW